MAGVVLVFRDISERRRQERAVQGAAAYANDLIANLREPLLVLDKDFRVVSANALRLKYAALRCSSRRCLMLVKCSVSLYMSVHHSPIARYPIVGGNHSSST